MHFVCINCRFFYELWPIFKLQFWLIFCLTNPLINKFDPPPKKYKDASDRINKAYGGWNEGQPHGIMKAENKNLDLFTVLC